MNIKFIGRPKNIKLVEVRYLMEFYGNILLGKRLANNINIEVKFCRRKELGADVIPADYDTRNRNHRDFWMTISNTLSYSENILAIGHEMAHVRQYARGEFTCVNGPIFWWKGMKYELSDETYPFTPWEKDAMKSERWLRYFYTEHLRNNGSYVQWA